MDAAWEEGWEVPRPALRVLQLDSSRLDRLLIEMLQRQIVQAFAPLGWLLEARKPDVTLLLSAVLYGLTVVRSGATYGQRLLNLRYHCGTTNRPPRAILLVHFACTVLLPWVWQRANDTLADTRDSTLTRRWRKIAGRLEKLSTVATYANHVAFLATGRYLSVADRICGMESVFEQEIPRRISYDILSRELLWHGFSEFAVFVLPHINLRRWWSMLARFVGRAGTGDNAMADQQLVIASDAKCAACGVAPPWSPYSAGCCDAVYCYYCVSVLAHDTGHVACKGCFASVPQARLRPCHAAIITRSASAT